MNKKDMIIGGNVYHVAVNWNALSNFLQVTGSDSLSAMANIAEIKPSQLSALLTECVREGERLDGGKLELSQEELCADVDIATMAEFIAFFTKACDPGVKKKD